MTRMADKRTKSIPTALTILLSFLYAMCTSGSERKYVSFLIQTRWKEVFIDDRKENDELNKDER